MRRLALIIALLAALVVAGSAAASVTYTGKVIYSGGVGCYGCDLIVKKKVCTQTWWGGQSCSWDFYTSTKTGPAGGFSVTVPNESGGSWIRYALYGRYTGPGSCPTYAFTSDWQNTTSGGTYTDGGFGTRALSYGSPPLAPVALAASPDYAC